VRYRVAVAEERLSRAWQALPPGTEVATSEGEQLRVVYPGRRNRGSGPDFLGAVLETREGELRGAVEVHQRTSDWARHRHGADREYAGVVLHVVGRDDGATSRATGGRQLPLLELDPATSDACASGSAALFPCASHPNSAPPLVQAGDERFDDNVTRLRRALDAGADVDQLAYVEVAAALGYSRNVEPMRTLAEHAPLAAVRAAGTAPRAEALLLGTAGLLPSQRHLPARRRRDAYAQTLERLWPLLRRPAALRAYQWDHAQSRPENSPVRRVAALARLALAWPEASLAAALRTHLNGPAAARRLAELFTVPCSDGYWAAHWDFGVAARGAVGGAVEHAAGNRVPALVGPSRAADVVVNVLLPLAAALAERDLDSSLAGAARTAYQSHPPLAENWITRLVRERAALFDERAAARTAREQQGLIAVYERTCHALRCADCVLGRRSP